MDNIKILINCFNTFLIVQVMRNALTIKRIPTDDHLVISHVLYDKKNVWISKEEF